MSSCTRQAWINCADARTASWGRSYFCEAELEEFEKISEFKAPWRPFLLAMNGTCLTDHVLTHKERFWWAMCSKQLKFYCIEALRLARPSIFNTRVLRPMGKKSEPVPLARHADHLTDITINGSVDLLDLVLSVEVGGQLQDVGPALAPGPYTAS